MTPKQEKRLQRVRQRERFLCARKTTRHFTSQLLSIARQIDIIVRGFAPDGKVINSPELEQSLRRYADMLTPWSRAVTTKLIARISQQNESAFREMGQEIGQNLAKEIRHAPTGELMRSLLREQMSLITSLPVEAAERVHELTLEGITTGTRADYVAKEILKSGEVAASRARTIARTEISRTAGLLTQSRAQHIGSEGYIWRTVGDADVRDLHKELEGKFIRWDDPPVAGSNGERAHAGCIYNCRCWSEPVIPDVM